MRLVERVEAAGCDMREHQRARTRVLDGGPRSKQRASQREMAIQSVTVDVTLRDQRIIERRASGDTNRRSVAAGAFAAGGQKQFVQRRIVDGADTSNPVLELFVR